MKEKITAAIKAKFPDVILSKKRLDEISDKLEGKITDESEIDAKLDEFNDYNPFAEIAKRDDAFANLQSKLKKSPQQQSPTKKKKTDDQADDGDDPEPADDMPEWFKRYKAETDAKLSAFEKEKTVGTIKQRLKETLKDVPKDFYEEWQLPESEDALEAFAEKVNTKYTAFKQDLVNQGLAVQTKPGGGNGGGKGDTMSKEQIKALNDKLMPKN